MSTDCAEEHASLRLAAGRLIAARYAQRLTLPVVAHALGVSPRTLQRAYARSGGVGFRQDLLDARIQAATRLLEAVPPLRVSEVARLVGYRDPAHFARAFARHRGSTPSEHRRGAPSQHRRGAPSRHRARDRS